MCSYGLGSAANRDLRCKQGLDSHFVAVCVRSSLPRRQSCWSNSIQYLLELAELSTKPWVRSSTTGIGFEKGLGSPRLQPGPIPPNLAIQSTRNQAPDVEKRITASQRGWIRVRRGNQCRTAASNLAGLQARMERSSVHAQRPENPLPASYSRDDSHRSRTGRQPAPAVLRH